MAPNRIPPTIAAPHPHWYPAQPAPQVPRIIMPSRPMLTTPERSEYRPPRPARPIGTASSRAAAIVEDDVSAFSPLMARTADSTIRPPTTSQAIRRARPPPRNSSARGARVLGPPPVVEGV